MEYLFILLVPIFGGLIYGVERVVKARIQNRVGPPVLQPFYDMGKLFDKETFMVNNYHIVFAIMYLLTLWVAVGLMILGDNMLYVIFIHLLASIFFVLSGYSVNSTYSHIGSNRELLSIVAYEPILILIAVGFYIQNGTFSIAMIQQNSPQIFNMFLLFLAFLLVVPIKLKKSPFDATEAHQEIVGGIEVEFSGMFYEIVYTAKWIEYIFIYLFLALFGGDSFLFQVILFLFVFMVVNIIDNSTARVKINHLVIITLFFGLSLSIINLVILGV